MTSDRAPDSKRLIGLPGLPLARGRSDSGERQSWRAMAADREIDAAAPTAPGLYKVRPPTHDELAKRRAIAALDDACYEAGSQRRLAEAAGINERSIRDWLELAQRSVPLHLLFRLPDRMALVFVRHVVRRWGRRALLELRAVIEEMLGEAEDQPVRRAM